MNCETNFVTILMHTTNFNEEQTYAQVDFSLSGYAYKEGRRFWRLKCPYLKF